MQQQCQDLEAAQWPGDEHAGPAAFAAAEVCAWPSAPSGQGLRHVPHVLKLVLPPAAKVAVFGDFHGAVHSLVRELVGLAERGLLDAQTLRLAPGMHLLFLGDYVDRGAWGVETLAIVMRLALANPGRVFPVRGNHEDLAMNHARSGGTFVAELAAKFPGIPEAERNALFRMYEVLPTAVFLGSASQHTTWNFPAKQDPAATEETPVQWQGMDMGKGVPIHGLDDYEHAEQLPASGADALWVLAAHGGMEIGWDPRPLLQVKPEYTPGRAMRQYARIAHLARSRWLNQLPEVFAADIPEYLRDDLEQGDVGNKTLWDAQCAAAEQACAGGVEDLESTHLHGAPWEGLEAPLRPCSVATACAAQPAPGNLRGWRGSPLDAPWQLGFQWWDFYVHDRTTPLGATRGRGLVLGEPVMAWSMRMAGIAAMLRAHQHNNNPVAGPMLDQLRTNGGIVNSLGRSSLVYTFLSGAVPGFDFHRDSFGLLQMQGDRPAAWALHHCQHVTLPPRIQLGERWLEVQPDLPRQELLSSFPDQPKVLHACQLDAVFTCT